MNFYSSTTSQEFIEWLRDSAIKAGMPPLFIDRIDELAAAPSEDEQEDAICKAVEEAEKAAFQEGEESGKADLDRMVADAEKEMYRAVCHAIEVHGAKKAALSAEQIHKVINHILWDVRP